MILFTTKMCRLTTVILEEDVDAVTKGLLGEGVLHFVKVTDVSKEAESYITNACPESVQGKITETRKRIETVFNVINYFPADVRELDVSTLTSIDVDASNRVLDKITVELQKIRDNQKYLQQEIHKLEEIKRQLMLFSSLKGDINLAEKYTFLDVQTGRIPAAKEYEFVSELYSLPSVEIKLGAGGKFLTFLLITMKRDSVLVDKILQSFSWEKIEYSDSINKLDANTLSEIDRRIDKLKAKQDEASQSVAELVFLKKQQLDDMWANLRMNELFYRMQSFYCRTSRTMIFSGWLPASKRKTVDAEIRSITKGKCYLEWSEPKNIENNNLEIPVKMENPKLLSPFEMLVKNYAIPKYGTVDPTPIVALTYLAMFGLMFGDVGHGFVLVLIGVIGTVFTAKSENKGVNKICQLMIWCGGAAMISGVLFGSYFGYSWFPPLWFYYHGIVVGYPGTGFVQSVYDILFITICFGIIVIGLGLVINWINCIATKSWFRLFLDKGGLLGAWMYGGGVYTAFYFAGSGYSQLPDTTLLFILLGIPAVLFMLKPPIEFYLHSKSGYAAKFSFAALIKFGMDWFVEMLEIFSGYLANTLSFMRVAGLGIAHVSIMVAFDQMARMTTPDGSFNAWSILILVLGNIVVIGLKGLVAGIQSVRLNYYEFFSKYFSGTGEAYAPISLKRNN
ncbi:MAG: ATPase V [Spirochaetes bacterium]|nr:ATPase V [Spirochaetota bacterium]